MLYTLCSGDDATLKGNAMKNHTGIIELRINGDPYGRGYTGVEYRDQTEYESGIGTYRGDIGARSRQWWRDYCRSNGYLLRMED